RALDAARADGWTTQEIFDAARGLRRQALDDLVAVYVAAGPHLRSGELTPREVTEKSRPLIEAAQRHGWSVDQIRDAVRAADPTAVQADGASGHPDDPASAQVGGGTAGAGVRTGFEAPEPPEPPEKPAGGRLSLAAAVELLMKSAGITDQEQLEAMLPSMVGQPFKPESLAREMRKHR
ncbi:hypothetical protein AB0D56_38705, partial [Streptomyces sp. NPDC048209]|uniref:hypothetical protein n=1 Tax=Streptomyces sp. NPDC048209 TaxID=3156689 RepID=UPI003431D87C